MNKPKPPAAARTAPTPREGSSPASDGIAVGRILRPHGLRGEVVVEVLSDRAERFAPGAELILTRSGQQPERVSVATARAHPSGLRLSLSGQQDRAAAEALRGAFLEVPGADLTPAPPGAFYPHDLIGYSCRDRREGELGTVQDLVANGGGLLLVIEGAGRQLLVPFVDSFLAAVDRTARTLELDLPEGLVETCASRS